MRNRVSIIARRARLLLAAAALAGLLAGCATHDETEIPWNQPRPGEGAIPLPSGFMRE